MPRMPSKRLPRGLLAAAALDALEDPQPDAAVLDRLLRGTPADTDIRVSNVSAIQLRIARMEIECS